MTIVYLFKYFNFISAYNDIFNKFSYYKRLNINIFKNFKIIYKYFLKPAFKNKYLFILSNKKTKTNIY